jgi:hypothetical protein
MTWPLLTLFLAAVFSLTAQTPPEAPKQEQPKPQILADDLKGGYQVIACDVNGDGKPDLIALASGMTDLFWFENPTWERHVMASNLPRMINVACWNRGPHEAPLVAVAYEFSMRPVESPGFVSQLKPTGDTRQPWKVIPFDKLPTSHRLRWADIDGSGNKVLVNAPLAAADAQAPNFAGHVPLSYYRIDDWKRQSISSAEEGILHGIFVTDWDHDGRDSLLIGSFLGIHLYKYGQDGHWARTEISKGSDKPWPKSGNSDISVGLLGKERFLAAIEPWHGNEAVVYRDHDGVWKREVIDDTLLDAHTIATADLNHDGNDEIIAGMRGKPYAVYLYSWDGASWKRHTLEQGDVAAASCAVADLDGDTYPDIACIGGATHNLVLYSNPMK